MLFIYLFNFTDIDFFYPVSTKYDDQQTANIVNRKMGAKHPVNLQ